MSTTMKIVISAIGVGALLVAPAMAKTRTHHHGAHYRAYSGPYEGGAAAYGGFVNNNDYASPRTGYKYFGPYNERIVTMPNGTVLGTDPDPTIRAYMRRDGIGPNGNRGIGASR